VSYVERQRALVHAAVYDSETSAVIEWFWDGGFDVTLGDSVNPDAQGRAKTWSEVDVWFRQQIL
jgi:hypothetical protein